MTASQNVLVLAGMQKRFGRQQALDGVSLQLRHGEVLGLLGPNGAGKSTLVRTIVGRVRPDAGSLHILGVSTTTRDRSARKALGWIPQEIALYPLLSVEQNLGTFGKYQGLSGGALLEGIDWALEWAGLKDRRGDRTGTLSGGLKRRLNMAAGVLHRPKIILMDEPTVGVDPQSREKIYSMIEQMKSEAVSIIYTTHYMEEAERLCDRIAVIDHGRIIEEGTRDELLERTIGNQRVARIECANDFSEAFLAEIGERGGRINGRVMEITLREPREIEPLLQRLEEQKLKIVDISVRTPTLESVFLHLTGRELRE